VDDAVATLQHLLLAHDPGGVLGLYLFGSFAVGGLRPSSDVDVLVIARRSLSAQDREEVTALLLQRSGRRATVAPGRPVELTVLALGDLVPWRYPPVCDYLYGEWLRDEFARGRLPARHVNPDVAVLVTTALQHSVRLHGPPLGDLLAPVPQADLHRSIVDGLDPLLDDLVGDERNVLLTLARMVVTMETNRIVPKDAAAHLVLPSLEEPGRSVLALAARAYVGAAEDDWDGLRQEAHHAAEHLADRVRSAGEDQRLSGSAAQRLSGS
jgi:streptomycin 3"-adenylyltransferase